MGDGVSAGLINAVEEGDETRVAELLASHPEFVKNELKDGMNALHVAARAGHEGIVARLLAHSPDLLDTEDGSHCPPLYYAVDRGHERVVTHLLAQNPICIDEVFYHAMRLGHVRVVAQLLAHTPRLIADTNSMMGDTTLHFASRCGHKELAELFLSVEPSLIDARNFWGELALWHAFNSGHESVVELLLDRRPEQALVANSNGDIFMHYILSRPCSEALAKKVWRLHPEESLHTRNNSGIRPFERMLGEGGNINAFEWLKWKLSLEDIVAAAKRAPPSAAKLQALAAVEQQCHQALDKQLFLLPDVVDIVIGYISGGRTN